MEQHTLFELNEHIRRVLALNLPEALWVSCEIFQISRSKGHCFLSLVEKGDGEGEELRARAEGIIWRKQYSRLQRKLGKDLPRLLQVGTQVLLQVRVDFHERYGYKLLVEDIDLSFTLGQMELKRRATLDQLEKAGHMGRNRSLPLPLVPQRLAVISSARAAGLQDFLRQLEQNEYGYRFALKLFPAAMQGVKTVEEVAWQLETINGKQQPFDAVVIIRGGGARLDLAAFDEYELCAAVARQQLPVLVGIGHEVDDVLLDRVAHTSLKTPTAVAEFLLNRLMQFEAQLLQSGQGIARLAQQRLQRENLSLERFQQQLQLLPRQQTRREQQRLQNLEGQMPAALRQRLRQADSELDRCEELLRLLHPEATLSRGYSLTLKDGRIISSAEALKTGDRITVRLKDGSINSQVQ